MDYFCILPGEKWTLGIQMLGRESRVQLAPGLRNMEWELGDNSWSGTKLEVC